MNCKDNFLHNDTMPSHAYEEDLRALAALNPERAAVRSHADTLLL